jgi:hypothetical protein
MLGGRGGDAKGGLSILKANFDLKGSLVPPATIVDFCLVLSLPYNNCTTLTA